MTSPPFPKIVSSKLVCVREKNPQNMSGFVLFLTVVCVAGSSHPKISYSSAFQLSLHMKPRLPRNDTVWRAPAYPSPPPFSSPPLSSRSAKEFYRGFYGTPEGVQHIRKKYGPEGLPSARSLYSITQELEEVRLANEHFLKIRGSAKCGQPLAKVIRVKDYHPDPAKEFLPRCTILHRCGDDSGCCDSDGFQCVPRALQEVTLYFYTIHLEKQGVQVGLDNTVEKLLFTNHTECECQAVNDQPRFEPPPDSDVPPLTVIATTTTEEPPTTTTVRAPPTSSKCRDCPVPFHKREYPDGRCSCDCFDREKPCLKVKRGRESLVEVERRCVEVAHCHSPQCEYGSYDYLSGRCAKRPEHHRRINENRNYHHPHRWTFFERD